ncbi:piggyBac transposable element-derived protein 4-like [Melitaea cinxia]|uniref:piggyBac transposable element-derived protein 4-like n=1 Tax=Melitaea cinxia TaxID=113334 RepID=UPI001E271B18|nr:piggyBac transposable element-derived protein 4-like [Melitaea cinxia]
MLTDENLDSGPSCSKQIEEVSHTEGGEDLTIPAEQSTSTTNVLSRTSSTDTCHNIRVPSPETTTVLLSDTDSSDDEENTWKKVLFPQKPDLDSFDSIPLQSRQFFPSRTRPVSYFSTFFNEDVIELIITQTNIYAEQNRSRNWTPVNSVEIKAFIGMIIMMGINPLPSIDLYWSSDPFFRNNEIAAVMPIKRFTKILENLHLNDNKEMPSREAPDYDKLYKIRPFLELINKACQNNAKNTTSQSIDEAMVKFKGVSSLKQYMPMKPVKRGYKIWTRADSATGYVFEFDVYTGKRDDNTTEVGLGGNVIKRLTKKLVDERFQGHVTFDNFFSSYEIMQHLYDKGIYATATVISRKDLPHFYKKSNKGKNLKLDRGEMKWRTKKNVAFVAWQDNKIISFLTTAFHPKLDKTFCDRKQKDGTKKAFQCPLAVLQYTERMGGVDRFDHLRSTYEVSRRSKKWWLRLFYFCVDLCIVNSFLLYTTNKRVHNPLSQLHFRLSLARGLINGYTSRKRSLESEPQYLKKKPKMSTNIQKKIGVDEDIRLSNVGIHRHEKIETWRRCRMCSTKTNNKRSKIQCSTCKVALCVVPCFDLFHSSD